MIQADVKNVSRVLFSKSATIGRIPALMSKPKSIMLQRIFNDKAGGNVASLYAYLSPDNVSYEGQYTADTGTTFTLQTGVDVKIVNFKPYAITGVTTTSTLNISQIPMNKNNPEILNIGVGYTIQIRDASTLSSETGKPDLNNQTFLVVAVTSTTIVINATLSNYKAWLSGGNINILLNADGQNVSEKGGEYGTETYIEFSQSSITPFLTSSIAEYSVYRLEVEGEV